MGKNIKINIEKYKEIEFISSNEENAIYRVAIPSSKEISVQQRQKILKNVSDTTIHFFNIEDLNNLKIIEAKLQEEVKEDKNEKSIFHRFYSILDI